MNLKSRQLSTCKLIVSQPQELGGGSWKQEEEQEDMLWGSSTMPRPTVTVAVFVAFDVVIGAVAVAAAVDGLVMLLLLQLL